MTERSIFLVVIDIADPDRGRRISIGPAIFRYARFSGWRIVATDFLRDLTPRQRAVAIKLLEGYPRKIIAQQLGIRLDTVGDHLKAIYIHYTVQSAE